MKTHLRIYAAAIVLILLCTSLIVYAELPGPTNSTITVRDSNGDTLTFNHTLTRIVSVDPSATATLYALGAYGDLVGGNAFDSYPPNSTLPNVGNSYEINIEEIVNLTPQVVLLYSSSTPTYASTLEQAGIPVLIDNPENITQIEEFTTMLGILTGTEKNASLINNWMNQSLSAINRVSANITGGPYSAFYYLSPGDWTAGNGTFISEILQLAHLRNIANGSGYYVMPEELIANDNPQVIILDQYVNYSTLNLTPYNHTSAFINSKIFTVFNDNFVQQPDFRVIYAITWLMDTVYPQVTAYLSLPSFPITLQYPPTTGM